MLPLWFPLDMSGAEEGGRLRNMFLLYILIQRSAVEQQKVSKTSVGQWTRWITAIFREDETRVFEMLTKGEENQ